MNCSATDPVSRLLDSKSTAIANLRRGAAHSLEGRLRERGKPMPLSYLYLAGPGFQFHPLWTDWS